jgi:prepilin-type N-terminal cleavage/methylation domain-containing protein
VCGLQTMPRQIPEKSPCSKGFSMIEILVSMVLFGLIATIISLYITGASQGAKRSDKMATAIQIAASQLENAKYKMQIERDLGRILGGIKYSGSYTDNHDSIFQGVNYTIQTNYTRPADSLQLMKVKSTIIWDRSRVELATTLFYSQ